VQSPDLRFFEENDALGVDVVADYRIAAVALRIHQYRLA
jgi:hypothetical protein